MWPELETNNSLSVSAEIKDTSITPTHLLSVLHNKP
jgi:hypothetical protein